MKFNMSDSRLKKEFQTLFQYIPKSDNYFSLPDNEDDENYNKSTNVQNEKEKNNPKYEDIKEVFPTLSVNLEYVKMKYNTMINSDIIVRDFTINVRGKQYSAFLLYIDGMVDSQIMNDFILEPLMMRNKNNLFDGGQNKVVSEAVSNNITVRKVKKFNIDEYLISCLMPQNSVKKVSEFSDIFSGVNSGNCALFVDTLPICFDIEVKGFKQRSIDSPNNEIVIKGPQEAFVENIRTNTSMIRRIVNNESLVIESIKIGSVTKTPCAICYIQDITNTDLISEVKFRLNNLEVDSLLSSGELEQLITDSNELGIPEVLSTERPDKATKYLLQGRVVVLINGSPYCLIMPATLVDFMTSPEDTNLNYRFGNFLRALRFIAMILTLLLPGIYVAVTSFHQEILPTELLYSILAAREGVPFPVIFEILVMEISFELIREAGLRVPSPIGPTIGIVGALVLGQAAVSAGIVSPILIIIVAITGISSFAIPDFSFGFHLRYYRFVFIILGYIAGFLGISLGLFVYLSVLSSLRSFGVFFTVPFSPHVDSKGNSYFLRPVWEREYRAPFIAPKKEQSQSNISMKWNVKE